MIDVLQATNKNSNHQTSDVHDTANTNRTETNCLLACTNSGYTPCGDVSVAYTTESVSTEWDGLLVIFSDHASTCFHCTKQGPPGLLIYP
ncbi:hypothetical protein BaRGS_00035860 [Batillaria attramentaria]|uniref:Uncharacterized protein n=1 Tax=Batillaria attramentaria TaxID=370345 RepID=A0ABD0JDI0_9CAEN